MSTPINNQIVANSPVAEKKAKAPRKPTLSAKYSKFLVGNYNMIQMLSAKGLLTDEAVETAYSEIKLFDNIEDQTAFYEASIEGSKATSKAMKKMVTQRLKPPKAPRAKKAKKEVDPNAQPKAKKPRTKKETKVAKDTEQDVVAQLVEAANALLVEVGDGDQLGSRVGGDGLYMPAADAAHADDGGPECAAHAGILFINGLLVIHYAGQ